MKSQNIKNDPEKLLEKLIDCIHKLVDSNIEVAKQQKYANQLKESELKIKSKELQLEKLKYISEKNEKI